MTVFPR